MTRKADMIAALQRKRPPGAVPIWEIEFQGWDAASGQHLVLGHEFEALSAAAQERVMHANADILVAVSREMCYAGLTAPNGYWEQAPGQLAYYCLPGDTRFRQCELLRQRCDEDLLLMAYTGAILGANYSPEWSYRLYDDPQSVDALACECLRGGLEFAKRFRDCGVRGAISAADIADNSGPFYNPEQMQRWILPYLAEWADAIRAMGMFSIVHSDGDLTRYLDKLAATGVDALQAIDPTAGMSLRQTREIVGNRLCLCGNIDCALLLTGRPQDVYEATRDLLITGKDGGALVLGTSNAVQPEVPIANYRAMIAAWKTFGEYPQ